jgi:hypothetical protein
VKAAELAKAVGCHPKTAKRYASQVGGKRIGLAWHFAESAPNRLRNLLNQRGEEQVKKMLKTKALKRAEAGKTGESSDSSGQKPKRGIEFSAEQIAAANRILDADTEDKAYSDADHKALLSILGSITDRVPYDLNYADGTTDTCWLERKTLEKADRLAKQNGVTVGELIGQLATCELKLIEGGAK